MSLTDIETARLKDLARRIRDGEYDSDRRPDVTLSELIVRNALPILGYAFVVGALVYVLGIIVLGVLIDTGIL